MNAKVFKKAALRMCLIGIALLLGVAGCAGTPKRSPVPHNTHLGPGQQPNKAEDREERKKQTAIGGNELKSLRAAVDNEDWASAAKILDALETRYRPEEE